MSKKYISIINNGEDLYVKDLEAQASIAELRSAVTGAMHYIGTSSNAITDGMEMIESGTPTSGQALELTIDGVKYRRTAPGQGDNWKQLKSGDVAIYSSGSSDTPKEFVYNDTTHKWSEFGSTGSLKALAFKDSANVSLSGGSTSKLATSSVGSASNFNAGTMFSQSYDESLEKLTLTAGSAPSLTITEKTVATGQVSDEAAGATIVTGLHTGGTAS